MFYSFFFKKEEILYSHLTLSILFSGIKLLKLLKLYSMKTLLRVDRTRILFVIRTSNHVSFNIAQFV